MMTPMRYIVLVLGIIVRSLPKCTLTLRADRTKDQFTLHFEFLA
jgi:hypothetical protein